MAPMKEEVEYLYHHIFLPPQLPAGHDAEIPESCLLKITLEALIAYKAIVPNTPAIDSVIAGFAAAGRVHVPTDSSIDESALLKTLIGLPIDCTLPLYVKAQNAGILLRRTTNGAIFEQFELAPSSAAVITTQGRLVRAFPGSATLVDKKAADDASFLPTISQTLAKMSSQHVAAMQPEIEKAGQKHAESRDTVSPGVVADLLIGAVLTAISTHDCQVSSIWKNTRDDVTMGEAELPWRRAPLWMLIRVSLQLTFSRAANMKGSHASYKMFMALLMSQVLDAALVQGFATEALYVMSTKITKRLIKLEGTITEGVKRVMEDTLLRCTKQISTRWINVQRRQPNLDLSSLAHLDFQSDSCIVLPDLDDHIISRATRAAASTRRTIDLSSGLREFPPDQLTTLDSIHGDYELINVMKFEEWVAASAQHAVSWNEDPDGACASVKTMMRKYHEVASQYYSQNPEAASIMTLTLLELWMACDRRAIATCPWLAEYDPGLTTDLFQSLLLPRKAQMQRLLKVEKYIQTRSQDARLNASHLFGEPRHRECFAARYFDSSAEHQELMNEIEDQAAQAREAKKAELHLRKLQYQQLVLQYQQAVCSYRTEPVPTDDGSHRTRLVHDDSGCVKCIFKQRADGLRIAIHEWPLPDHVSKAKAVVFELDVPIWYAAWRDSTVFLLVDVLCMNFGQDPARLEWSLSEDPHLKDDLLAIEDQRIVLWSKTKPASKTHYNLKYVQDATEDQVCVPNGLQYVYFDTDTKFFLAKLNRTSGFDMKFTYTLPGRSEALSRFMVRPHNAPDGPNPNTVIATQSDCPEHMTLAEYTELCSLPLGHGIQWLNILLQLAVPTIDFRKDETVLFVLQCIYQAGPQHGTDDFERAAHIINRQSTFTKLLFDKLEDAMSKVQENWECANALLIFISIAARVLSMTSVTWKRQRSISFLCRARDIAFGWMSTLRKKTTDAIDPVERREFREKSMEIALVCAATFDADEPDLNEMLNVSDGASVLIQCAIVLAERAWNKVNEQGSLSSLINMRYRRILSQAHPIFVTSKVGLDNAISSIWQDYGQESREWKSVPSASNHWLETEVELSEGHAMPIHYDTLSGKFLVNGKPLTALPASYLTDPLYIALFGKWSVEVMASTLPGMRFTITKPWQGHTIHLAKDGTGRLVIQALHEGITYEVLPAHLLQFEFPSHFVNDYVHWYDSMNDVVQFRPKKDPWELSSQKVWTLSQQMGRSVWQLRKNGHCILGSQSQASRQLSDILSPLAELSEIHLMANLQHGSLEIEIPRMQLGFALDAGASRLSSRDHRGMQVDTDQSLGTLIGFQSKLMLTDRKKTRRMVLIPDGIVRHARSGDHMNVVIDKKSIKKVHPVQVDTRLGRLVDNGSIQCKLQMSYLHALTSFFLPDPLTRMSGTEQALTIINSASFRSFELLDEDDLILLQKIMSLTPARKYYPSSDSPMLQKVTWDSQLNALSQHGGFREAVLSVLKQVRRSNLFYPGAGIKTSRLSKVVEQNESDHALLDRDAIRTSTFRSSGFGAERHCTSFDAEYEARDRCTRSENTSNATIISRMIYNGQSGANARHFSGPELESIWTKLKHLGRMPHEDDPLERNMMQYDTSWLENKSTLLEYMLPLHKMLTGKGATPVDRYALMMWLSTMAFANDADLVTLQMIALLYTSPDLRQVSIPNLEDSQPSLGLECNAPEVVSKLEELARDARVDFEHSPAAMMEAKSGEQPSQTRSRRRARYDNWKDNAVRTFVKGVKSQWPKGSSAQRPEPTAPNMQQYTGYLNIDQAMSDVQKLFSALWNNNLLFRYLQQVEVAIRGLTAHKMEIPMRRLQLPSQYIKVKYSGIPTSRLFLRAAPPVSRLCPKLRVDVVDHKDDAVAPVGLHLSSMVQQLKTTAVGQERMYLDDLSSSLQALELRVIGQPVLPAARLLQNHLSACEEYLATLYHSISQAISGSLGTVRDRALNRPMVSPTLLLKQLSHDQWSSLSPDWQSVMVKYGVALSALQRAERLVKTAESSQDDLRSELANPGHTNWDPMKHPESLLLEVESGITIREVQEQIASEMRSPANGKNSVMQLNMGEGKSSVIVPIVAAALANKSQLVRVIVAKPQSKQMAQMLISKLGGLLNRRIYHMPFSRAVKLDQSTTSTVDALCRECMRNGGVMLMQPEHILSFRLMGPECFISRREETGKAVLRIQDFLDSSTRDIVDESDENFSVKFELIYTLGSQQSIDMTPKRWIFIHEILDIAKDYTMQMLEDEPLGLEVTSRATGGFPRLRVLKAETGDRLIEFIACHICETGLREFPIADQPEALRKAVLIYITKYDLEKHEIDLVQKSALWTGQTKMLLLLLRGLFAAGVLAFALEQKRWRVNYGLTSRVPKTRLAVPYRAKDSPSPRSEFSHPDVVIVFTSLSYYYGGLSDEELFLAFGHLAKSDQPETEYSLWLHDVNMPEEFTTMQGINLKDRPTCTSVVFPPLRHAKGAIDYFLGHIVFPKEMRQFPHKMSGSGWDIGKVKTLPTTGFSGTNDSRALLPLDVHHLDLPDQKHTNALVLDYLLQPENIVTMMTSNTDLYATDAEQLLANVLSLESSPKVILDVGAQILELDNREVAKTWLKMCPNSRIQAAVFCNENDELFVIDRNGHDESLQTSSFATRLDSCLVYLDEAHTRGIDLKLPADYRAAVTLGAGLTKDRLVQACMRMRKLGKGQSVVFCVSTEIETKIRACTRKDNGEMIEVGDVLTWSISETYEEIRRGIPLWVTQGHRFVLQEDLWSAASGSGSTELTSTSAREFLEPEAQTMQHRYGPGRDFQTSLAKLERSEHPRFQAIVEHCRSFDYRSQGARRLQEEQERERELSPEVEEERVVERAAAALPEENKVHADVREFVRFGRLNPGSKAWRPAFSALRDTSVAAGFKDLIKLDRYPGLLVTEDFVRTVKKTGEDHVSDVYQRPVQWILSVRKAAYHIAVDQIMVISPFEAQQLLADVMVSPVVAMHMYKPRCHIGHPSLDKLDFFTICNRPLQLNVPRSLAVQLNVFAGQLYFDSFEEYLEVCQFLQLSGQAAKVGMKVDNDGFIRCDGQARIGAGLRLSESPVAFVREFLSKVRRHGEDIAKTHFGQLLDRQLMKKEDFGNDDDASV